MTTKKEDVKVAEEKVTEEKVAEDVKNAIDPNEALKERVPYMAFKDDDKYKDDIKVIVNGHNFIIQRGVVVNIPRYVVLVLESKDRELRAANIYLEEAIKAGRGL